MKKQGACLTDIVEECRDTTQSVPIFENLIGSTWNVKGATISRVNPETGQMEEVISGDGEVADADYWAIFEQADDTFQSSVENERYFEFLHAVTLGVASIESYLNYRVAYWNGANPENKISDQERVSNIEYKIDRLVPLMTNGINVNKSGQEWQHFVNLKKMRNNQIIHTKSAYSAKTKTELKNEMNEFHNGIAGLLLHLHILFNASCPSRIIKAYYRAPVILI
jgi:hypothetical protein